MNILNNTNRLEKLIYFIGYLISNKGGCVDEVKQLLAKTRIAMDKNMEKYYNVNRITKNRLGSQQYLGYHGSNFAQRYQYYKETVSRPYFSILHSRILSFFGPVSMHDTNSIECLVTFEDLCLWRPLKTPGSEYGYQCYGPIKLSHPRPVPRMRAPRWLLAERDGDIVKCALLTSTSTT